VSSDPLEPFHGQDEDRRAADLDLERIGHEKLARLHDRRHRVDHLGPGVACLADDAEDVIDLGIVDAENDRRVRLLEEATGAVQSRGPEVAVQQGVDEGPRVLVVDDRDDELHGAEYRRAASTFDVQLGVGRSVLVRSGATAPCRGSGGVRCGPPEVRNRTREGEASVSPSADRPSPLDALAAGVAAVVHGPDLDEAIGSLLGGVVAAVGATSATVSLQDPDRPDPELALTIGLDEAAQQAAVAAAADPAHPLTTAARERIEASAGSTLAVPLIAARDGIDEALGAIAITFPDRTTPTEADTTLIRLVANITALAVDRARLASTVAERSEWFERLAHTDPLTGLANLRTISRVLELEIARAGRQGSEVSVAIFDVDDFAATNEAAGRDAGDDVLRTIAAVLAGSVRLVDTVARSGADEFLLVAPGSAGATVAQRVLDGIADLPSVGGRTVSVAAGVARFPNDGSDAESVLAAAQGALERSRTGGRGEVETTEA
jgi:diguanylate cyclase (GGDEF)-like protein